MADFANYNNENIESNLLATQSSAGLLSAEDKVNLEELYNNKYNYGSCRYIQLPDAGNKIYKFRIYSRQKIPFLLLITYNMTISVFTGVIFKEEEVINSPSNFESLLVFKATDGYSSINSRILKATTEYIDVEFSIVTDAFWNACSLIAPGTLIESI